MIKRISILVTTILIVAGSTLVAQQIERIGFDDKDSVDGHYLAIRPMSGKIKGTIVLFTSFLPPEALLAETKLHNTAFVNDLLTIVASTKMNFFADTSTVERINKLLDHVIKKFDADSSKFVLAGYDDGGTVALRYTELAVEKPMATTITPAAVFGIETNVDLAGLWNRSENEIKKNFYPASVGDARFYLDRLKNTLGSPSENPERYSAASPFMRSSEAEGNERFLRQIPVRLYYDADIAWYLTERRKSFYDINLADGSEMIKRLMLSGNKKAELMIAKEPGMRSNGQRHPNSMSVVEEVECVQWIKSSLGIFDLRTFKPPYELPSQAGWAEERFELPPEFATNISVKGVEDIRFMPGWGDTLSMEHWSYSFLWWLHDSPKPDAAMLETNLRTYFTGLVGRNIQGLDPATITPTTVSIRKIKTAANDIETWSGTITMFDYHTKKKMTLQALIHAKQISAEQKTAGQAAIIFALSPQPFSHEVWKKLQVIDLGFRAGGH